MQIWAILHHRFADGISAQYPRCAAVARGQLVIEFEVALLSFEFIFLSLSAESFARHYGNSQASQVLENYQSPTEMQNCRIAS